MKNYINTPLNEIPAWRIENLLLALSLLEPSVKTMTIISEWNELLQEAYKESREAEEELSSGIKRSN